MSTEEQKAIEKKARRANCRKPDVVLAVIEDRLERMERYNDDGKFVAGADWIEAMLELTDELRRSIAALESKGGARGN